MTSGNLSGAFILIYGFPGFINSGVKKYRRLTQATPPPPHPPARSPVSVSHFGDDVIILKAKSDDAINIL